jgi:hypothetical protein
MKQGRIQWKVFALSLVLAVSLTACKRETNTSGNPEVGEATGAAIHDKVMRQSESERNPDTTVVPSPVGHQRMVPTVPSGHRMLEHKDYMEGCRKLCVSPQAKPHQAVESHDPAFCEQYCGCSYEKMRNEVPIADLRAYARNEATPSTGHIGGIIQQCIKAAQDWQRNKSKPSAAKVGDPGNPQSSGDLAQ